MQSVGSLEQGQEIGIEDGSKALLALGKVGYFRDWCVVSSATMKQLLELNSATGLCCVKENQCLNEKSVLLETVKIHEFYS